MISKPLSQEIVKFKSDFEGHAKMTYFDIKYGQYSKSYEDIRWVLYVIKRVFGDVNDTTLSGLFDSENVLLERGELASSLNLNFYERRVYESFSFHDSFIEFIHQVWDLSDQANNYRIKEAIYHLMSTYIFSSYNRDPNLLTSFLRKFLFSFLFGKKNLEKVEYFAYYLFDTIFHVIYSKDTDKNSIDKVNFELIIFFKFLIDTENLKPIKEFYQSMVDRNVYSPRDILSKSKTFIKTGVDIQIIGKADLYIQNQRFLGNPLLIKDYERIMFLFKNIILPGSDELKKFYDGYEKELDYRFKRNSHVEIIIVLLAYSLEQGNIDFVKSILYFNQPKHSFSTFGNREKIPVRSPSWHYFLSKLDSVYSRYSWMGNDYEDLNYYLHLIFVIFFIRLMDFEEKDEMHLITILRYGKEILNAEELLSFLKKLKILANVGEENLQFLEDNFGGEEIKLKLILETFRTFEP